MLGFRPKLPISQDEREWVDEAFKKLSLIMGRDKMLRARVILPTPEFFPDPFDATESSANRLFRRTCGYMDVPFEDIELHIEPDRVGALKNVLPAWSAGSRYPAGLYSNAEDGTKTYIRLAGSLLNDPLGLVATVAHELGHFILLGGDRIDPHAEDMEPLTDLLTVFLGLGVFTANASARFEQHQDAITQGWSTRRLGYLSQEIYGYALARFAFERAENHPEWVDMLSTNVKVYYKRSRVWLKKLSPT